jgi:trehalose-6-phosphate synthase
VTQTAEALHQALSMPEAERQRRRGALAQAAGALPPTAWLQAQLDALDTAAEPGGPGSPAPGRWASGRLARLRRRAR